MDPLLLFEREEAAKILHISIRLLDHYIAEEEILVRRFGRRVLIARGELEKFSRRDHGGREVRPRKPRKPRNAVVVGLEAAR